METQKSQIAILVLNQGWIGDGYCDDINNNLDCTYDGGDCCLDYVYENYCDECLCLEWILMYNAYALNDFYYVVCIYILRILSNNKQVVTLVIFDQFVSEAVVKKWKSSNRYPNPSKIKSRAMIMPQLIYKPHSHIRVLNGL